MINLYQETHIDPVVQSPHEGETQWGCDVWRISIFCVNRYSFVTNLLSKREQVALCFFLVGRKRVTQLVVMSLCSHSCFSPLSKLGDWFPLCYN